ncbi:hypothetical protein CY35_16G073200 [Sphagnum magellanicum]|nr:hypothetical protein CY35_16G073200 [Sphagnum magellanicum]
MVIGIRWHPYLVLLSSSLVTKFQTITNDNFKAVQHRVVLNPDSSRISIVCGITPNLDDIVSPALELVDDTHPDLYHPYSYADF